MRPSVSPRFVTSTVGRARRSLAGSLLLNSGRQFLLSPKHQRLVDRRDVSFDSPTVINTTLLNLVVLIYSDNSIQV